MTYSIIQKSQLEGGLRLDAEYYQLEYLNLVENLNSLDAVPIRDIAKNPKRKFKPQKGKTFQYIEISEVDLSTGEYNKKEILGEDAPDRAQWVVKQNDVITSTVRPIRSATSLIREDAQNSVCSSGFAVLKTERVEPEYLFVYLKSEPIIKLLDRKTTATMYPAVTIDDILDTKIYLGNNKAREEIKNQVIESQQELKNAKILYSQAENLLLEELELKNFEIEEDLSYIVNLSDIKSAHRIDAEYFQPKYEELIAKIKMQNIKSLLNVIENIQAKFNPILEPERKFRYVELANINSSIGIIDGFSEVSGEEAPSRAKRILKDGDVIVSSVEGSLKKVALVHKEQDGYLASTGFFQFRSKEILPEVMLVLAKSLVLQMQLEKQTSGTILMAVPKEAIKNIVIPILPEPTQQKIASSVCQSHQARKRAKELLEEAKQKVEKMILGEVN